jgi:hypothetical protein
MNLEQFLKRFEREQRRRKAKWIVTGSRIRIQGGQCPIEFVSAVGSGDLVVGAKMIQLNSNSREAIIRAADNADRCSNRVRRRLLKICGL